MTAKVLCLALGLGALACDTPQYVNPDTVALIVTDGDGVERVNRCHYIPVLLGSQVKARYLVEDELRATLTLTRDELSLLFEDAGRAVASLSVPSPQFAEEAREVMAAPPADYTVELMSPCTPQEF